MCFAPLILEKALEYSVKSTSSIIIVTIDLPIIIAGFNCIVMVIRDYWLLLWIFYYWHEWALTLEIQSWWFYNLSERLILWSKIDLVNLQEQIFYSEQVYPKTVQLLLLGCCESKYHIYLVTLILVLYWTFFLAFLVCECVFSQVQWWGYFWISNANSTFNTLRDTHCRGTCYHHFKIYYLKSYLRIREHN